MQVILAMATRSPATLESILGEGRMGLAREARDHDPKGEIMKQSLLFPLQVALNRWLVWTWAFEPRLRLAAIKHVVGGLALGNSDEDFVAGMRQVLVAFITYFFGDDPESLPHGRLTIEEIAAGVRAGRRRPRQPRAARG